VSTWTLIDWTIQTGVSFSCEDQQIPVVLSDSNVRSRADVPLVRNEPKHGRIQGSLARSVSAMLLYFWFSNFSASVVNVELQHLRASGVVDALVVKSMTVPSRAKLEYSTWTPLQVELVPDASRPYATSRRLVKGDQSINSALFHRFIRVFCSRDNRTSVQQHNRAHHSRAI